jgi:hypothetical protein
MPVPIHTVSGRFTFCWSGHNPLPLSTRFLRFCRERLFSSQDTQENILVGCCAKQFAGWFHPHHNTLFLLSGKKAWFAESVNGNIKAAWKQKFPGSVRHLCSAPATLLLPFLLFAKLLLTDLCKATSKWYDAEYAFSTDIYDQGTQEILASKASKEEEITLFNAHVIETLSPSSTNDWKALEVALQTTDYVLRLPRHRPGGGELRSRGAAKRQRLHGAGARTTGAAGIERVSKEQEEEQGKTQEQEQKMAKKTQVPSHEPAVAKVAASIVETQDGDAEEEDGEDINHDMQHAFELEALPRNVHIALSDAHAMELLQFSNTAA